ncbi:M50 family metallopeptidase [uncultured Peptoniphilus sp.]|uniref:M50 family metallopeptidase n=1 Tax=uncultured Peptoniphilus sp. TaxID=254354 RepID=UPI00280470D4|nr:M50 family metallopeptidase [uncultured Peptoniphilus sp.]
MKRKTLENIFTVVAFLATAFFVGFASGQIVNYAKEFIVIEIENINNIFWFAVIFLSIYLIVMIHIIFHEAGHMIGGFITGYRFLYFRIGSTTLVRTDNGFKIRKLKVPGTGGQCIMVPPEMKDGDYPVVIYNLGGGLMNIILSLVAVIIIKTYSLNPVALGFLEIFAIVGIYIGIVNLVPLKVISNDGANIFYLKNDLEERIALHKILNDEEDIINDKEVKETSLNIDEADLSKTFIQGLFINKMEDRFYKMDFEEAKFIGEKLLSKSKMNMTFEFMVKITLSTIYLLEGNHEKTNEFLKDKSLRKYLKNKFVLQIEILNYAKERILEGKDGEKFKKRIEKMKDKYIYPSHMKAAFEIMDKIDEVADKKSIE